MAVTLAQIYSSVDAWQALSGMRKSPKVAYRLMKYCRKVLEEAKLIDQHRNELIKEFGEPDDKGNHQIKQGTPEIEAYQQKMMEYLETESDIEPLDMTMDDLIQALEDSSENYITEAQLAQLEPFFTDAEEEEQKPKRESKKNRRRRRRQQKEESHEHEETDQ